MRFANIAHLITGNFASALLGLVAFTLSARALGTHDFGQLAMILSFTRVVEKTVSFQSWQPIIKYGAGLRDAEHRDDLRMLLKFGFLLDFGGAVCAWLIAVVTALCAGALLGWTTATTQLLVLYSGVLLFQLSGTPAAVQRMAGQFRLVAYGQLVNLTLRVALCLVGVVYGFGFHYIAAVWGGTQVLGSLTSLALAFGTLRRQGVRGVLSVPMRGLRSRFPGIWGFAWSANLSLTLRASTQELDTLLVGALTDPASAGLYHIAKRVGRVGMQAGNQVQTVLYPDVARIWAGRDLSKLKRVVFQMEAVLLAFGMLGIAVLAAIIHPLLKWTAGPEFMAAAPLVIVQMVAVAFVLSGSAARSALLAMGRQRDVLWIVATAVSSFYLSAFLLIPRIGPMGGNFAHIVLGTIWTIGLGVALRRAFRSAGADDTAVPVAGRLRSADLAASEGI